MKQLIISISLSLILSVLAFGQSDMNHRKFTNAITKLSEIGRDVYELGFNDGIQCMILIQLKHKYSDSQDTPTLKDMADECRVAWYVDKAGD